MQRVITILYYFMLAASAALFLSFYLAPIVPGSEANPEPVTTSLALQYAFVVLIFAALVAIVFPVINGIRNPKNVGRNLITVLGVVIVLGVCYYFSSGEKLNLVNYSGTDNEYGVLKIVDTGLFAMYLSFLGAILAIVYSEVRKYFL